MWEKERGGSIGYLPAAASAVLFLALRPCPLAPLLLVETGVEEEEKATRNCVPLLFDFCGSQGSP